MKKVYAKNFIEGLARGFFGGSVIYVGVGIAVIGTAMIFGSIG